MQWPGGIVRFMQQFVEGSEGIGSKIAYESFWKLCPQPCELHCRYLQPQHNCQCGLTSMTGRGWYPLFQAQSVRHAIF